MSQTPHPGWSRRFTHAARWLFLLALTLAAAATVGRMFVVERLDEQIRLEVEARLQAAYPDLQVSVGAARRIEKKGIEVRNIRIAVPGTPSSKGPLLRVDELMISCPTDLRYLLAGELRVFGLTIRRLQVRAVRNSQGNWDVQKLWPLPRFQGDSPPDAVIEDARVEIWDESRPGQPPCVLHSIHVQVSPQTEWLRMTGRLWADHFAQVAMEGRVSTRTGAWQLTGRVGNVDLSPRLLQALPPELAGFLSPLEQIRTRAELEFTVSQDAPTGEHGRAASVPETAAVAGAGSHGEDSTSVAEVRQAVRDQPAAPAAPADRPAVRFVVQGRLFEGRIEDARLPFPLDDVSARVYLDNQRIQIDAFQARSGGATIRMDTHVQSWLDKPRIVLHTRILGLMLDARLRSALPASLRTTWDQFAPLGSIDLEVHLEDTPADQTLELIADCQDVSFRHVKFPYPMHHGRGRLRYRDGLLTVEDFVAEASGQNVHVACQVRNPGPDFVGWLELRSEGPVPVDERMLTSLPEHPRQVLRSMNPTGMVLLRHCRFQRDRADVPPYGSLELELQECSVQYSEFPYPLSKVQGLVRMDGNRWELRNLRGYHGTTHLECNGGWISRPDGEEGIQLNLNFVGTDVTLDDDLRTAIAARSPGGASVWANLRPKGSLDYLAVDIDYRTSRGKMDLTIHAHEQPQVDHSTGRSISLFPTWLPYRIDQVTGAVQMTEGKIQLQDVSGRHGPTQWRVVGVCELLGSDGWQLQLNRITADRLTLDHELLAALPSSFGSALRGLDLAGLLSLDGAIALQGRGGLPPSSQWNVLLEVADGSLRGGAEFQHIHGGVRLIGKKDSEMFYSLGELDIDSVHCKGVQITQVRGPLYVDQNQLLFGSSAEANRRDRPPRQVTGKSFGGDLALDAQLALNEQLPYQLQLTLNRGNLNQLLQQAGSQTLRDVQGQVSGLIQLQGDGRAAHTLRGKGYVRLRDADVYELPVMVALLSVLSLKTPDTTAFTKSDIDFRLEGDHVHLDRIDLYGDAISLKGRGWANFQKQIQLNFYTLVGRDELQLPLIRTVLAEASRRILEIQVVGTLAEPHVQRTAFPELDDTLQTLFPELPRRRNASTDTRVPSTAAGGWSGGLR